MYNDHIITPKQFFGKRPNNRRYTASDGGHGLGGRGVFNQYMGGEAKTTADFSPFFYKALKSFPFK